MLGGMVEGWKVFGRSEISGVGRFGDDRGGGGAGFVGFPVGFSGGGAALASPSPPTASSSILSASRRRIRCSRNSKDGWGRSPCW